MSENIRIYQGLNGSSLTLTAYIGAGNDKNNPRRTNIQLNIDNSFCQLTESQLLDLIQTLANRILHREGYTATTYTSTVPTIESDGTITEEENE